MTSSEQKRRERSILDFYLKLIGLQGTITSQECPDFVIAAGGQRIGIEITEYHQPKHSGREFPRTIVEAEWQRIKDAVVQYRDVHAGLENLSVLLSFIDLKVPRRKQHLDFIRAIHGEIGRLTPGISDRSTKIHINKKHLPVLRTYLKAIEVRTVDCYMEWDWNHNFASVGTSDDELTNLLGDKFSSKRPEKVDELHLVITGDGPTGGTYIGYLSPELLESWTNLNRSLDRSDFDVVVILNYEETCIWRKGHGWTSIPHA